MCWAAWLENDNIGSRKEKEKHLKRSLWWSSFTKTKVWMLKHFQEIVHIVNNDFVSWMWTFKMSTKHNWAKWSDLLYLECLKCFMKPKYVFSFHHWLSCALLNLTLNFCMFPCCFLSMWLGITLRRDGPFVLRTGGRNPGK